MPAYPNPIDPRLLDLVMRDHDHAIFYANKVLQTPEGAEVVDPDIRMLKHILVKLTIYGVISIDSVNSFSIFCYQKDFIDQSKDKIRQSFDDLFHKDPLVRLKAGGSAALLDVEGALSYLEDHAAVLNLLFWGMPEVGRRFMAFYDELSEGEGGALPPESELLPLIKDFYDGIMNVQKAAVNKLSATHATGILLPLMLVTAKMTPSEYATAAMAINLERSHFPVDREKPAEAHKELHSQAIKALEHVSFYTGANADMEPGIRDLIGAGEGYNLEFKTSFRWDVRQEKKNPAIEHASLKTITAFLNSSGGHLLIGVEDDGRVEGIEIDKFENDDKFLLHFWNLIKSSMGQEVTPFIKTTLEKIDGGTVCQVKCLRSPVPVFLRQKGFGEEFYIRTGPSSASLEIREALKYIAERFPTK